MTRPDDREVPVVKRGDLGQPKALGDGRHGGIDDAKRKIKISLREFGHAADVSERSSSSVTVETTKRPGRGARVEHLRELGVGPVDHVVIAGAVLPRMARSIV